MRVGSPAIGGRAPEAHPKYPIDSLPMTENFAVPRSSMNGGDSHQRRGPYRAPNEAPRTCEEVNAGKVQRRPFEIVGATGSS